MVANIEGNYHIKDKEIRLTPFKYRIKYIEKIMCTWKNKMEPRIKCLIYEKIKARRGKIKNVVG